VWYAFFSVTVINAYEFFVVSTELIVVVGDMVETVAQPEVNSVPKMAKIDRYFFITDRSGSSGQSLGQTSSLPDVGIVGVDNAA
jgi:hypothetical protein